MKVRFSYLKEKFANPDAIWERVRKTVIEGDFTLGKEVQEFETRFAAMMGAKYAVGVANGTDALVLSLWAAGVRAGDEVIAPANTFVASLGAIGILQATPVLVDVGSDYVMDANLIERMITPKTKAIMPVHFCGNPVDMEKVMAIAHRHRIPVIEDACQAFLAEYNGVCVGNFGLAGAFSLHPLKILNVWGDGGVISTNSYQLYRELKLLQNHGMQTRDLITRFPCWNSRLDSVHAAVANFQLDDVPKHVEKRRENAAYYDDQLRGVVKIIPRDAAKKSCFHLYFIEVFPEIRDDLVKFLIENGVEAKIHYPTPLYRQPAIAYQGLKNYDRADDQADHYLTLPCDEHLTREQQDYVIAKIREYFKDMSRR